MALVWDDIKTFRRHMEAMRIFRQSHPGIPPEGLRPLNKIPVSPDKNPAGGQGILTSFTPARARIILVPIWKMKSTEGSQN